MFVSHTPHLGPRSAPATPQTSNVYGRAGLILAVAAALLFWIPMVYPTIGIAAVTLSAMGWSRARAGTATNGKLAVAGLILGVLALIVPVIVLLGVATLILRAQ